MKRLLLFMILSLIQGVQAQDTLPQSDKLVTGYDHKRDIISRDYVTGPYLIYNCERKHWVCVLEEYFEDCKEMRAEDERFNRPQARCAPVGEFDVKFSCFQEQLRLVSNVDPTKLCILESWKKKNITLD